MTTPLSRPRQAPRAPGPKNGIERGGRRGICILLWVTSIHVLLSAAAQAQERVYLTKAEIEQTLIGKGLRSRNLLTGMVSHWEFFSDGHVDFVNLSWAGTASGTWTIKEDGLMCVTMKSRTGCRFWFKSNDAFANIHSKEPGAATAAEVQLE